MPYFLTFLMLTRNFHRSANFFSKFSAKFSGKIFSIACLLFKYKRSYFRIIEQYKIFGMKCCRSINVKRLKQYNIRSAQLRVERAAAEEDVTKLLWLTMDLHFCKNWKK